MSYSVLKDSSKQHVRVEESVYVIARVSVEHWRPFFESAVYQIADQYVGS
jgi:hypothetical protein